MNRITEAESSSNRIKSMARRDETNGIAGEEKDSTVRVAMMTIVKREREREREREHHQTSKRIIAISSHLSDMP